MAAIMAGFDTETTGTDPVNDDICQFACIVHRDSDPEDHTLSFDMLCNPGRPIHPDASAIHKITDEMVVDARPAGEVVFEWLDELCQLANQRQETLILMGHNTQFDRRFIAKHVVVPPEVKTICTMRLARRIVPEATNHTLEYLYREHYKLSSPRTLTAHDALCDVWMCFELIQHWQACKYLPTDYRAIADSLETPYTLPVMPFSKKHKGKPFSQIPRFFLQWLVDQGDDMDIDVRHTAQVWLRGPRG